MRIEASKEVYVYVLNADDAGKTFRLFPLADHQPDNPLAPSKEHRLPGDVGVDWVGHERRRARTFRDHGQPGTGGCRRSLRALDTWCRGGPHSGNDYHA